MEVRKLITVTNMIVDTDSAFMTSDIAEIDTHSLLHS